VVAPPSDTALKATEVCALSSALMQLSMSVCMDVWMDLCLCMNV
jgi:hypothetical protein